MSVGWETKPLVTLCEVFADGDWIETKDQSPDGIRLIQTGNVGDGEFKSRDGKARYVSEKTFARLKCTEVFPGDCLISRLPDPVGRSCILPETGDRMITAVDCTIVRFSQGRVLPEFFNYYAQSHKYLRAVDTECTGTTRKRISRAKLGQVSVPVPPLPEQRRIVAILDEAFEGIAAAKANAERNLRNARDVFGSRLHEVFKKSYARGVTQLAALATDITDGDHLPPPKSQQGVPFITIGDIDKMSGVIDFGDTFNVPRTYFDGLKSNRRPRKGDVLYTVTGSYGIPVLIDFDKEFCFQRHIALVRPSEATDSGWLNFLLQSPQVMKQASEQATGTAQKTVSLKTLRAFDVPTVPLQEQRRDAKTLSDTHRQMRAMEEQYRRKSTALDELKASLLHQAFTGNL